MTEKDYDAAAEWAEHDMTLPRVLAVARPRQPSVASWSNAHRAAGRRSTRKPAQAKSRLLARSDCPAPWTRTSSPIRKAFIASPARSCARP
jgi:hypothetical protein